MPEKEYQRLTCAQPRSGFAVALTSRSSLWLGKDHLLCIDSSGYTETYKRFYFRDIQAITIRTSKRRTILNWVLVVPTILFLALMFAALSSRSHWDTGAIIIYLIFVSVFGVPFLINNLLGPTCICHLRTAVQIEELPSLNRLRRARKVLNRLRPFIIAVQGGLSPEEIPVRLRAAAGSPDGVATAPGVSAPPPEAPPVSS